MKNYEVNKHRRPADMTNKTKQDNWPVDCVKMKCRQAASIQLHFTAPKYKNLTNSCIKHLVSEKQDCTKTTGACGHTAE